MNRVTITAPATAPRGQRWRIVAEPNKAITIVGSDATNKNAARAKR